MAERWLLSFRSAQGDMTFSCVVRAEGGDELKGEIEHRVMILEMETGRPWVCEAVRPFQEKGKEGENNG
jgi:hypothetical protein